MKRDLIIIREINQMLIKGAKMKLYDSQSDKEEEGVRRSREER